MIKPKLLQQYYIQELNLGKSLHLLLKAGGFQYQS